MNSNQEHFLYFTENYDERILSLDDMNEAERKAANFILENREICARLSIHEMATKCGCSSATIVRLCKHLGYSGYAELKFQIQKSTGFAKDNLSIALNDNSSSTKQKSLQFTLYHIKATVDSIDDEMLNLAAQTIAKAKIIMFSAMGSASGVALAGTSLFLSNSLNAIFPTDDLLQMRTAANLSKDDVIIGISYDGYSKVVADSFMVAKQAGASTILITSIEDTLLTKYADIILYTPTRNNRNVLNYSSTLMCQMMIIQLLLVSVWQHINHKRSSRISTLRQYTNLKRYPDDTDIVEVPGETTHRYNEL